MICNWNDTASERSPLFSLWNDTKNPALAMQQGRDECGSVLFNQIGKRRGSF